MKLGLAVLCFALFAQQARAEPILVAWGQPSYAPGDTWEIEQGGGAWRPLVPIWSAGGLHSALVEASLPATVRARTWRGDVVSEASEPHVYVPEPPIWIGLMAGISSIMILLRFRSSVALDQLSDRRRLPFERTK